MERSVPVLVARKTFIDFRIRVEISFMMSGVSRIAFSVTACFRSAAHLGELLGKLTAYISIQAFRYKIKALFRVLEV